MTRYLGLDLGSVTCGVSESDTGFIARTVETIRFKPDDYNTAMDKVLAIVAEKKPDLIVIGYPLMLNDDEGPKAPLCREFGKCLKRRAALKLFFRMSVSQPLKVRIYFLKRICHERKERKRLIRWLL